MLSPRALKISFVLGVALLCVSAAQREKLPDQRSLLEDVYAEPLQEAAGIAPFTVTLNGVPYTIKPHYIYVMNGLVVSYHHTHAWWDYYRQVSRDDINLADLCIVWGKNISSGVYKKMAFSNGSWTCYYRAHSREAQKEFCGACLSNNHIISDNDEVRATLLKVRPGDQVYIRGYLADYTSAEWNGSWRKTSSTRNDNLCEVVYATDIKILKAANGFWRVLFPASLLLIFLSVLGYLRWAVTFPGHYLNV